MSVVWYLCGGGGGGGSYPFPGYYAGQGGGGGGEVKTGMLTLRKNSAYTIRVGRGDINICKKRISKFT